MKNILKLTLATLFLVFVACDDENEAPDPIAPTGLNLENPGIQEFTISSANSTSEDEALKLTWDNNLGSGNVNVEMSLSSAFDNVATLATTDQNFISISFAELNQRISDLGGVALADNTANFRVVFGEVQSNTISFIVNSAALPPASAILNAPAGGEIYTIDATLASEVIQTVGWIYSNDSGFEVTYEVEAALSGTDFADIVSAGTVINENSLDWTHSALNTVAIQAGIPAGETGDLDVRVKATYTDGAEVTSYSDPVTITVSPIFLLPRLAVPGNHQGWQPDESVADFVPYIASSGVGETDYEGFMWLDGEYKYVEPNDEGLFVWGNTDWEDDGTFSGTMTTTGSGNLIGAPAGFYYVTGDTATGQYRRELKDWNMIGSATPNGWGGDTTLTYNATTRVWEGTFNLVPGEFKFRANGDWSNPLNNFGRDNNGDGSLDFNGPNLTWDQEGTFTVTLDLNSPRGYTFTIE